ncbi:MAG TPA: hypothetical protein VGI11_17935 [Variovorax sp.]
MKRTLLALIAATFALAAGSSFAQSPAEPAAPVAKTKHSHKHSSHKSASAHKKSAKPTA